MKTQSGLWFKQIGLGLCVLMVCGGIGLMFPGLAAKQYDRHKPVAQHRTSAINLVKNGSFELGVEPGAYTTLKLGDTNIHDWRISRNNVDYVGSYFQSANGKRHIDLDGTPGAGGISQTIPTQPGQRYKLTFQLAGNPQCGPDIKQVGVGVGEQTFNFTKPAGIVWTEKSAEFKAASDQTTLEFYSKNGPDSNCGALLDQVRVVSLGSGHGPSIGDNRILEPSAAVASATFAGDWETQWGVMTLSIDGQNVRGFYPHDRGKIIGTLSKNGREIQGQWTEAPSYAPPNDGGRFVFQLTPDGKAFNGRWGYGDQQLTHSDWSGRRLETPRR